MVSEPDLHTFYICLDYKQSLVLDLVIANYSQVYSKYEFAFFTMHSLYPFYYFYYKIHLQR